MNIIIKYIKSFINKYIVSEDPNDQEVEEVFQTQLKEFETLKKPTSPKKKRGRPKKKK